MSMTTSFLKLHAKIKRQLSHEHHRFRIISIDVKDRVPGPFVRHPCSTTWNASIQRITGGKSDLIVDHNMHRTTGAVAAGFRQIQGFHHHSLDRLNAASP